MRFSQKLIFYLIGAITVVTLISATLQVRQEKQRLRDELHRRAQVFGESVQESLQPMTADKSFARSAQRIVNRFERRGELAGIAVFDSNGERLASSPGLDPQADATLPQVAAALHQGVESGGYLHIGSAYMHVFALPLTRGTDVVGAVVVFHYAGGIGQESDRIWLEALLRALVQVLLITFITLLVVRVSFEGQVARMVQWMKAIRTGKSLPRFEFAGEDVFQPLTHEVTNLGKSLASAREAAEVEARLREANESLWTAERLRVQVQNKLGGSRLFAVSNREPYEHIHKNGGIEAVMPASGLVTALEPILRTCNGTWIAQGTGDADREVVDEFDRVPVPPDHPQYSLRRVWLTEEEEQGFYYGFSNEGIWPLCHIAYTRPVFRIEDWEAYQAVNQKFATATLEEMTGDDNPVVLAQDYHLALFPKMIKARRPEARVAIFWHIPWPNPELFGICPWQRELLEGLLAADLIGFHTQGHCNNFLETANRVLESRVEWDHFGVNAGGHFTAVKPFPISVDFDEGANASRLAAPPSQMRASLLKPFGVEATYMGVGVDRADYTKGIPERFRGIERFLEKYPNYRGQLTFVQIAAPSRTHIPRYHELQAEIAVEAHRINARFETGRWKPIVLIDRQQNHREIAEFYAAADFCMVTSLHDGMNLVAKEFIASRQDERGVLILSRFAGAVHELPDALVVNPYDFEQLSEAIRTSIEMDPQEIIARMRRMRASVKEHNVYRWAASLINTLAEIRMDRPEQVASL